MYKRFSIAASLLLFGLRIAQAGSLSQTITFDAIPNQILGVSPFLAAAQSSSGLAVSLSSTTPIVCKLAADTVLLLSAGTCSLTATQSGNGAFNAATPVTRTFTVTVANVSGSFVQTAGSPFGVGSRPSLVVVGDFNGDGKADLATANEFDNNVTLLLGNGLGGFTAAASPYPTLGTAPASLAVGDFNGDGFQDVAVANSLSNSVTLLLGNGSGTFTAATGSPFRVGSGASSIVVGDFNGDGNQDVATANYNDNNITVLLGNGSGTLTAAPGSPFTVGTNPYYLVTGDFSGDNILDLAVANFNDNTVTLLIGNGSGGFTPSASSPLAAGALPVSIVAGDFRGTGILDLAIANYTANTVTVLLGNGSGGFTAAPGGPIPVGNLPTSIVVGDFNGDGLRDLFVTNYGSNNATVLLGNGTGAFTATPSSPWALGKAPISAAVWDFNGDGIEDLAVANVTDETDTVLLGFASGSTPQTITFGPLSNVTNGASPRSITATASSGLTVSFASSTSDVCTVAGNTVSIVSTGTCSITASQAGSATFAPAGTVVQSFTVGFQTITFGALPVEIVGDPPVTLTASASSGLAVTFASTSTGVCTVSGATLTVVAAGTCSITASQPGNGLYAAAAPVTVTFTVDPAFTDVSSSDYYYTAIELMLSKGITLGCSSTPFKYCPQDAVTRGQMAVFIIRSIFGGNNFPYNATPYFTDVPSNHPFFQWIQKMKELGITDGCTATTYCPDDNITRGQMSVFLVRARYGTSANFTFSGTPHFTDVPTQYPFFKWIQKLKEVGLTNGCTATTYCPDANVIRGDMAIFVMRGGFNLLLPAGSPVLTTVSPTGITAGKTVTVTLTGLNTHFVQGTTVVSAGTGVTVQSVTVNSATSLTAVFVVSAGATPGPQSVVVTTGAEEAVAPNALTITKDPAVGAIADWTGNNTTVNSISSLAGSLINGATYASATSRTLGLPDAKAFSLNGTNSYVQAAAGETASLSGPRTLVAWVYPNATTSGVGMPVLEGGQNLADDIFGISGTMGSCDTAGQYHLYLDHTGTCYISDSSLAPNTWSLVAAVFDGTNVVFYINGVASVAVPAQMSDYGLATYKIGGNTLGGGSTGPSFDGLLNEVQVYGRALSTAEIQGIYTP